MSSRKRSASGAANTTPPAPVEVVDAVVSEVLHDVDGVPDEMVPFGADCAGSYEGVPGPEDAEDAGDADAGDEGDADAGDEGDADAGDEGEDEKVAVGPATVKRGKWKTGGKAGGGEPLPPAAPKEKQPLYKSRFTSVEIADQIYDAAHCFTQGWQPKRVRDHLRETYGITNISVLESRCREARGVLLRDISAIDKRELVAQVSTVMFEVMKQAMEKGQGNNVVGAARLLLEQAGLVGRKQ